MKILLSILLFINGSVFSQRYEFYPGEYQGFVKDNTTNRLYGIGQGGTGIGSNTGFIGLPIFCQFPTNPTFIKMASACLHGGIAIDLSKNIYATGVNDNGILGNGTTTGGSSTFIQISVDSAGNPFTNLFYVNMFANGSGTGAVACKTNGEIWGWGNLTGGMRGSGASGNANTTRPVQILGLSAGDSAIKVLGGLVLMVLTRNGTAYKVYTSSSSSDLSGTGNGDGILHVAYSASHVLDIAGAGFFSFILDNSPGNIFGWGYYLNLWSGGTTGSLLTPTNVMGRLGFSPNTIIKMKAGPSIQFAIKTDSSLWAWGEQVTGGLGNGNSFDYNLYGLSPYPTGTPKFPYKWDQGGVNSEFVTMIPTQVLPCNKMMDVFTGPTLAPYSFAIDKNDNMFFTGRNKGGIAADGILPTDYINGNSASNLPNSFTTWTFKPIFPFNDASNILTVPPRCITNPGDVGCSQITYPSNSPPVFSNFNNIFSSTGSATINPTITPNGSGVVIAQIRVTEDVISGCPTSVIVQPYSSNTTINNLSKGVHTISVSATDSKGNVTAQSITINVGGVFIPYGSRLIIH